MRFDIFENPTWEVRTKEIFYGTQAKVTEHEDFEARELDAGRIEKTATRKDPMFLQQKTLLDSLELEWWSTFHLRVSLILLWL